jgi:hypothetical protein
LTPPSEAVIGRHAELDCRFDESHVAERLRHVAQELPRLRIDLLAAEADVVRVRQERLHEHIRLLAGRQLGSNGGDRRAQPRVVGLVEPHPRGQEHDGIQPVGTGVALVAAARGRPTAALDEVALPDQREEIGGLGEAREVVRRRAVAVHRHRDRCKRAALIRRARRVDQLWPRRTMTPVNSTATGSTKRWPFTSS